MNDGIAFSAPTGAGTGCSEERIKERRHAVASSRVVIAEQSAQVWLQRTARAEALVEHAVLGPAGRAEVRGGNPGADSANLLGVGDRPRAHAVQLPPLPAETVVRGSPAPLAGAGPRKCGARDETEQGTEIVSEAVTGGVSFAKSKDVQRLPTARRLALWLTVFPTDRLIPNWTGQCQLITGLGDQGSQVRVLSPRHARTARRRSADAPAPSGHGEVALQEIREPLAEESRTPRVAVFGKEVGKALPSVRL
jgi:hypothetical protein